MLTLPIGVAPRVEAMRLLKAARRPRFALRNLRYHVGLRPSREAHIFVLGPPRSGTTLVRQMLLAHPLLTGPDKDTFFFLSWNLHDFVVDEIPPGEMAALKAQDLDSIRLFDAIARWMKEASRARSFVEKSPEHALRLAFLRRYFPRSRFIFVYRDPRDAFISTRRLPDMKSIAADQYAKLWRDCVMTRLKQQDSSQIFDLRYEDLCAAPERQLRSMMTFLGYDVVPEQLAPQYYSVTAFARRPSHARLNQPISSDTVGQWRAALPTELRAPIERIVAAQMRTLGYSLEVSVPSRSMI